MKLNLEIETNCVGCMLRYLQQIGKNIAAKVVDPSERYDDETENKRIEFEYECDIACDGYSGAFELDDEESWETADKACARGDEALNAFWPKPVKVASSRATEGPSDA